jgi:hypothetical protein
MAIDKSVLIGTGLGLFVGVVSGSTYFYYEIWSKQGDKTKEETILASLLIIPPVTGSLIGYFASK